MAIFDCGQQRVCVRVVYDGVASAGKTTNVRQLAELFATQQKSEVFSPAEMHGRTLYFDWLQIGAGMVCGFPLLCQVITVPGQLVLTPRRRHLLSTADVVVHVCDSDAQSAPRAFDGLALLAEIERERGQQMPLVVQANKQDQAQAVPGAELLLQLGRTSVPVVEAIASDGIGVIDTFVAAVRAVVRAIQRRVERGEVLVPVRRAESAAAVLDKLNAEEVDPEWAVEMMLEEAWNQFALGDLEEDAAPVSDAHARASVKPEAKRETKRPTSGDSPEEYVTQTVTFPGEHVPTGFVWPAHTGRTVLRALGGEPEAKQPVTIGRDGSARMTMAEFVLTTERDRRYENVESARQALVRAARERTQLGSLLAPETVLVAQPESDGASWLWTIVPRTRSIADVVASLDRAAPAREALLTAFGIALGDALKVEAAHGVALDLSPHAFGATQAGTRYLGPVHGPAADQPARNAGRALEASLIELARICDDVEPVLGALEATIAAKLAPEELAKLARTTKWRPPTALPVALRDAAIRIQAAIDRGRRAA